MSVSVSICLDLLDDEDEDEEELDKGISSPLVEFDAEDRVEKPDLFDLVEEDSDDCCFPTSGFC